MFLLRRKKNCFKPTKYPIQCDLFGNFHALYMITDCINPLLHYQYHTQYKSQTGEGGGDSFNQVLVLELVVLLISVALPLGRWTSEQKVRGSILGWFMENVPLEKEL